MSGNDFRGEQEISELTRLLPVPDERDLPAGRQQILKEHLMTELRQLDPMNRPPASDYRRKRPRGLAAVAGAGVLAVAVAATAFVAGQAMSAHPKSSPQSSGPARAGGSAAAMLLAKIADAAASQPTPTVRDSEFMYIRSAVAYEEDTIVNGRETSTMEKPHERQVWLPVADLCVTGLLTEDGSSTPLSPFPVVNGKVEYPPAAKAGRPSQPGAPGLNFTCPSEGYLGDATYRLLQSLPTSPHALLNYLKTGKKWTNDDPATEIGDLIREAIIPPAVAAAPIAWRRFSRARSWSPTRRTPSASTASELPGPVPMQRMSTGPSGSSTRPACSTSASGTTTPRQAWCTAKALSSSALSSIRQASCRRALLRQVPKASNKRSGGAQPVGCPS